MHLTIRYGQWMFEDARAALLFNNSYNPAKRAASVQVQVVVFIQTQQQEALARGESPQDSLDTLIRASAGGLSNFIKSTVTLHSVLTDRIDQMRPSQQLTLKVAPRPRTYLV